MKELSDSDATFFRIIMPSVLKEKKLVLPKMFSEKYGDELSKVIRLIVPASGIWKVGVEKFGDVFLLCDGWQKFMSHHSILSGYFLVFKYRGNSEFGVQLFDLRGVRIQYPSSGSSETPRCNMDSLLSEELCNDAKVVNEEVEEEEEGDDVDDEHDDDASIAIIDSPFARTRLRSSKRVSSIECLNHVCKRRKQEVSPINLGYQSSRSTDGVEPESSNDLNQEGCSRIAGMQKPSSGNYSNREVSTDSEENRALEAAKSYQSLNPSFIVLLKTYNIYNANIVRVPAKFSRECMPHCPKVIKVQDSDNKLWPMHCIARGGKLMSLSKGWSHFVREKELNPGDVCVFELIQTNALLKVTIFRA